MSAYDNAVGMGKTMIQHGVSVTLDSIKSFNLSLEEGTKALAEINVPPVLKSLPNWIWWRRENDTKVPYVAGNWNRHASSTDSSTWTTFENAIKDAVLSGSQGIGFAIHGAATEKKIVGFDLDGCRNPKTGELTEWAEVFVDEAVSYTEVTPSETGLRVWVIGDLPDGPRVFNMNPSAGFGEKVKIEVFDSARYFTVTGQTYGNLLAQRDIQSRNLEPLYELCHDVRKRFPAPKVDPSVGDFKDHACAQIQHSGTVHTTKLELLLHGNIVQTKPFVVEDGCGNSVEYPSHSEADMALATLLAINGKSAEEITRTFCESALYRQKWERQDYRENIIRKALESAEKLKTAAKQAQEQRQSSVQEHIAPVEQQKEQQKQSLEKAITLAEFNSCKPATVRKYDYDGLIPTKYFVLWCGARKAEKSLFALRKAMHDACGKDWMNRKNMTGPVEVLYFDAENDDADLDERWNELIQEFDTGERSLINANLHLIRGKRLKQENRIDIEWTNKLFWQELAAKYLNIRVVYLDCWYQLQSIPAKDNELQKKVLEFFEDIFPKRTIFLLHHTGRESQESLLKKHPTWLRIIGADRWSNKIAGGNVLTKKADMIICQERFGEKDEENVETYWCIDFQAYSRSGGIETGILLSFEPDFGDENHEYKYRRKLVIKLSSLAASALNQLRGKGPWDSRYAVIKELKWAPGGKQYRAVAELIIKGFLADKPNFHLAEGYQGAIEEAAENPILSQSAREFLEEQLLMPNGEPQPDGMPVEVMFHNASTRGISAESLRKAKQRMPILAFHKEDDVSVQEWWKLTAVPKKEKRKQGAGRKPKVMIPVAAGARLSFDRPEPTIVGLKQAVA